MTTQTMPTPRNFNQLNQQPEQHTGGHKPPRRSSGIVWKTVIAIVAVLALIGPLSVFAVSMVGLASYTKEAQNGAMPENIDKLEIRTSRASVSVVDSAEIGDRDMPPESQVTGWFDARYRQSKNDSERTSPVTVRTEGSTAVVDVDPRGTHGIDVTIGLPADLAEKLNLDLNVSRGSIEVLGKYKDIAVAMTGGAVDVEGEAEKLALDVKGGEAEAEGRFDEASFKVQGGAVTGLPIEAKKKVSVNVTAGTADLQLGPDTQPAEGVDLSVAAGSASLLLPEAKAVKNGRGYVIVDDGQANLGSTTIDIEARRVADMSNVGKDIPLHVNAGAGDLEIGYWADDEDVSGDEDDYEDLVDDLGEDFDEFDN